MTQPATSEHLWSEQAWLAVVADAVQQRQRIARGDLAPEMPHALRALDRLATGALPLDGVVVAARHGGGRPAPTFGVLHDAETPLEPGYAAAIARMFAATREDKSAHYMTDPAELWGVLDDLLTAWHCGNGNTNSVGLEQAGRASFTRAQWLGDAGSRQLERNGTVMRALRTRYGIGCWWMTDQQIRDAHARKITGGWCTHDDARRVLGGTTHTDPGTGFPRDVQMQLADGPGSAQTGDLTMADAASLEKQVAALGQQLAYVLGQLQGQEKDSQGDRGWLCADGQARSLVDIGRATFAHARTAATRPLPAAVPGETVDLEVAGEPLTAETVRAIVAEELQALVLTVVPDQSR